MSVHGQHRSEGWRRVRSGAAWGVGYGLAFGLFLVVVVLLEPDVPDEPGVATISDWPIVAIGTVVAAALAAAVGAVLDPLLDSAARRLPPGLGITLSAGVLVTIALAAGYEWVLHGVAGDLTREPAVVLPVVVVPSLLGAANWVLARRRTSPMRRPAALDPRTDT